MNQDPIEAARWEFSEAWYAGGNPDVDEFCRRHPECGPELREKIEDFLFVAQRLPGVGQVDGDEEPLAALPTKPMQTGMVLGDFRIVKEIGRGGQGVVYEAEQISLRRRVALKVLPSHLSLCDDAVGKFRREAEAGGRQKHPGIVAVHAMGEFDGIHFIAHELVEGGRSLADRLDDLRGGGDLPVGYFREAAAMAADVADALHHAHESGVIHRDVKPSNILLDERDRPKVTDFGLARVEDALALTRTGDFSGTPYYMSPEQAGRNRKGIDFRTDVYSMGVTLYEMLTLDVPFDAQTTPDVLRKILFDEPRDPRRANSRVPRDLAVICLKAMEKKQEHRYQDMAEFGDDLRRFLAGETILARPAGALTRVGKRVRRNPALSGALGLAVVAVVALLVGAVSSYIKISRANQELIGQRLIAGSSAQLDKDPGLAINLALKGFDKAPGREAQNALFEALSQCLERKCFRIDLIEVAVFSPDGSLIAVGLTDGTVEIRDSTTGELAAPRIEGHKAAVLDVAFSHDGQRIASCSMDCTVLVRDVESGRELDGLPAFNHDRAVRSVGASNDMTAVIWDLRGNIAPTSLQNHRWHVVDAEFSPDGKLVITVSKGGDFHIWDAETGEELASDDLYPRIPCAASFCPKSESREFLVATEDGTVEIRKFNGLSLRDTAAFRHVGAKIVDAAYSTDGSLVATALRDGTARIWKVAYCKEYFASFTDHLGGSGSVREAILELSNPSYIKECIELKGHKGGLRSVAFCSDGQRLVTASRDKTVRTWAMKSLITAVPREKGWTNWKLSPRADLVVQRSESNRGLRVVDLSTGKEVALWRAMFDAHEGSVAEPIEQTFTGEARIMPLPLKTTLFQWEDPVTKELQAIENTDECHFKRCTVSADSKRLAACAQGNSLKVWDLTQGDLIWLAEHGRDCDLLALSPDHQKLAVFLTDYTVRLIDVDRDKPYDERKEIACSQKYDRKASSLSLSTGGRMVLVGFDDGSAQIWFPFGEQSDVWLRGHGDKVVRGVISDDSRFVATVSRDGSARLWHASTGECVSYFEEHKSGINDVVFSPDSRLLITASDDETARVWETDGGRERFGQFSHASPVSRVFFSGDGESVLTVTVDGNTAFWNVSTKELVSMYSHRSALDLAGLRGKEKIVVSTERGGPLLSWRAKKIVEFARAHKPRDLSPNEHRLYIDSPGDRESLPDDLNTPIGNGSGYIGEGDFDEQSEKPGTKTRLLVELPIKRHQKNEIVELDPAEIGPFLCFGRRKDKETETEHEALLRVDPSRSFSVTTLCDLEENKNRRELSVKPDGTMVCYLEDAHGDDKEIFLVVHEICNNSASEPKILCSVGTDLAYSSAWHPVLNKIYYFTNSNDPSLGGGSIHTIDVDGTGDAQPKRIIGRPGQVFNRPHISSDGRFILFVHFAGESEATKQETWKAQLDESGDFACRPKRLTRDEISDLLARFTSDKQKIIRACGDRDDCWAFVTMGPDGKDPEIVYDAKRNGKCLMCGFCLSFTDLLACMVESEEDDRIKHIRIVDLATGRETTIKASDIASSWESLEWPCFLEVDGG